MYNKIILSWLSNDDHYVIFLKIEMVNKECENEKKTAKEEFEVCQTRTID